ncbi:hypothetical protein ACFY2Q_12185 [Micromonospora sp. NPDC000316]|uniref:hypothetical protein n=1 Tax=Micromonospora sp. NPDC000316 TaxID=3364216 RepID=UPI0036B172E2
MACLPGLLACRRRLLIGLRRLLIGMRRVLVCLPGSLACQRWQPISQRLPSIRVERAPTWADPAEIHRHNGRSSGEIPPGVV